MNRSGSLAALMALSYFIASDAYGSAPSATNQQTAQQQAEAINRKGSDLSLQNSTTFGMQALMDLSSFNIPGAVNNGTQAYGKYRNSEDMDELGDQNINLKNSMSSGGSSAKAISTDTTYKRLDTKFLYEGKAAEVAAEFEKRSGMKRETFLKELSTISENKIDADDPKLVDKVISRFEAFTAKIPNAEFRGNIEKGIRMIPATVRNGLIAKGISKFSSFMADSGAGANSMQQLAAISNMDKKPAETKPAALLEKPKAPERAIASGAPSAPKAAAPGSEDRPYLIGLNDEGVDNPQDLNKIVQEALNAQKQDEDGEVSIFQQVSRRYRIVAPLVSSVGSGA